MPTASTLEDLGLIAHRTNRFADAWHRPGYHHNSVEALRHLGTLHRDLGDHAAARTAWSRASRLLPDDRETAVLLAELSG